MIEMEMSRDIQDFSPNIISFLNKRQVICLLIALAYGGPLFLLLGDMEITIKMTIVVVAMTPAIACGWVKRYNMALEKFFFKCIVPMFLTPRKRKYKTKDIYGFEDKAKEKERLIPFKEVKPKKLKRREKKREKMLYKQHNSRK